MVKIIDIDSLFDKYIEGFVYANIGKVKPEEIENKIPELYIKFGNEKLKELDGKTPNEYYNDFSGEELLTCLETHLNTSVAISDFLCEAITKNPNNEDALIKGLEKQESEQFVLYVLNMLADMNSKKPIKKYLEFILWDYSETVREVATEILCNFAEDIKEDILKEFNEVSSNKKACLTEVLANCKNDDRVFDILVAEFVKNQKEIPIYANYLAKYGDNRAIPFLLASIENEKTPYSDFEELRFAIEALGGEYTKERDFTKDKTFKKIKGSALEKSSTKLDD